MATPHVVGIVSLMLSVESVADAGAGDDDAAGRPRRRSRPGARARRRCAARASPTPPRQSPRRRVAAAPTPPGRIREDVAREHGIDRRHVGQAAVGRERRRCELRVLRRHGRTTRRADTAWVSAGGATSATVSGLAPGTNYYWQVRATNTAGDTTADGGSWWTFATQPGAAPPGAFSKTSPGNGAGTSAAASR